jgi:uncharacterized coiled-coil protein SlyX
MEEGNRIAILEKRVDAQAELISRLMTQVRALKKSGEKQEDYYQDLLERRFSAGPMKIPDVGRTDITTPDQHIEIKKWGRYHEVPGQLAKYQQGCPRKGLAVYFFGTVPGQSRLRQVEALMRSANIAMYSIDEDDEIVEYPYIPLSVLSKKLPDSFSDWFHQTFEPTTGSKVHTHEVATAYGASVCLVTQYMEAMGLDVPKAAQRAVPPCSCNNAKRCVIGYRIRCDP